MARSQTRFKYYSKQLDFQLQVINQVDNKFLACLINTTDDTECEGMGVHLILFLFVVFLLLIFIGLKSQGIF